MATLPRLPPAPCPPCHTHRKALAAPGGTTRSLHSRHVWHGQPSKTERCSRVRDMARVEAGWGEGKYGWVLRLNQGWGGCLFPFLSYLPTDHSLSHPLLYHPSSSLFCGLCTCSPWVWAIKLKDLSTGGWRQSGGIIRHGKHKSNRFKLWLLDMLLCHIAEWWPWCNAVWHGRSEFKQICLQNSSLHQLMSCWISLIWRMISFQPLGMLYFHVGITCMKNVLMC